MPEESIVTRGNQITLTREIREKMHIIVGDIVTLNIDGDILMISKRNPKVFDDFEEFLPERFDNLNSVAFRV